MIVSGAYIICNGCFFFFQAEDGIRDLVRSRGLGDVYKRQGLTMPTHSAAQMATSDMAVLMTTAPIPGRSATDLSLIHI